MWGAIRHYAQNDEFCALVPDLAGALPEMEGVVRQRSEAAAGFEYIGGGSKGDCRASPSPISALHSTTYLILTLLHTLNPHAIPTMRSPLITFSLVAAAVSPSLAAAHSNSPKFGRSITHPRVTEVENASPGSLNFKRSGMNGLGLDKLTAGNPIDELLPQGAAASSSKPAPSKADGDTPSLPFDPSDPASAANIPDPETIPSAGLANVPSAPVEPAQPASPYSGGQQNAPASNDDGVPGRHVPSSTCLASCRSLTFELT